MIELRRTFSRKRIDCRIESKNKIRFKSNDSSEDNPPMVSGNVLIVFGKRIDVNSFKPPIVSGNVSKDVF